MRVCDDPYHIEITIVSSHTLPSREKKGLVDIEHFLGVAHSAVLISDVPIEMLPCDMMRNNVAIVLI